jgi:uncharacterized protein (TIGR03435 family)
MRGFIPLLAASCYCAAQNPDPSLTFEVASVKTASQPAGFVTSKKSAAGSVPASADPIRFSRRNATLASLLLAAYELRPQQLIGPQWLTSERYEIEAKVPEGATAAQQLVMLRNLLTERFRMQAHREIKELPVYEMTIARGGSKLKESAPGPKPLPPLRPGGPFFLSFKDGVTAVGLREQGSTEALAARLSSEADRLILDRTGLQGNYGIVLSWTPPASSAPAAAATGDPAAPDPGISLLTALESQLGLKLVPKKGMVEVLVVDRAEKVPTEN